MNTDILDLNRDIKSDALPKPPGFLKKFTEHDEDVFRDRRGLILAKAWQTAISPASGFFMYFIMFYFFGSSLNIYTLIMICSVAISHLKNITSID